MEGLDGKVVTTLTGSTAASTGASAFSVYGASKAALRSFVRHSLLELAPRLIRVDVLVPGATSTTGLHGLSQTRGAGSTVRGRSGDAGEITTPAVSPASDEGNFVDGGALVADGSQIQI